jgi:signal transduction histidine kinase
MKFTAPPEASGGAAAVKEKAKVLLKVDIDNQQLRFTVEDTGIGVPIENAENIFDEFFQVNEYYDGTGIGLTVARSIARRLGGDIVLDTDYTAGARFVLALPL